MNAGENIITILILSGIGFLFYKIHQKKKWKLLGKIILTIFVISLLISAGFYFYNRYENRPQEVNSLADISIGMKKVDVTIKKGKPDTEHVSEEGVLSLYYKDYSGTIKMFLNINSDNEVYRICSFQSSDNVLGLGKWDSLEEVIKKLGEPQEKSINKEGTSMIITYPQYNVAFEIIEGNVNMTCVTTQEKMGFTEEYTEV
jgi:hypothetical protein